MTWLYLDRRFLQRNGCAMTIKYPLDERGILYILHLNDDAGWVYSA